MSITQREGVIICIPKGDKSRELIKNWRPISLLNVVYKIGSASIANRIKKVLPKLIEKDQTGFVPGRYIGDNIRILYDMIHYINSKNLSGLLVLIDFEKAFDSLEWSFMYKVLKKFGFGEDLIRWIEAFYSDIKSRILVNGMLSTDLNINRGCRQGDPISPYLFILSVEALACKIRSLKDIKGIKINDTDFKITQFADDTSFLLEGDKTSYEILFKQLELFGKTSGLRINKEKTINIWLGKHRNSKIKYMSHVDMCWNPPKFKVLGIWLNNNLENLDDLNFQDKYYETKRLFNIWAKRIVTPLGRIVILKSIILSKLIYLWIMLPNPPDKQIEKLQKECYKFIWDNKVDKIKRTVAVRRIKDGGLNIPDLKIYIITLKLNWIRKILNNNAAKWAEIINATNPEALQLDRLCLNEDNINNLNPFWKDTFNAYKALDRNIMINKAEELLAEPIHNNEKFKIGKNVILFNEWKAHNVLRVQDLIANNGKFVTFHDFALKHGLTPRLLDYLGCVASIKKYIKTCNIKLKTNIAEEQTKTSIILKKSKGAKYLTEFFLDNKTNPKACTKWEELLGKKINWEEKYIFINCIDEVKMKWFQLKISNRILVTNIVLARMGITQQIQCNFCEKEKDSILHYLWECEFAQIFWKEFLDMLKHNCKHCERINLNPELVLFGKDNSNKTDGGFDTLLLNAKYFIYRNRIGKTKPILEVFKRELKNLIKCEKYSYSIKMNENKFDGKWKHYSPLLQIL